MIDIWMAQAALSSFQCQLDVHERYRRQQADMDRMKREADEIRSASRVTEFAYDPEDPSVTILIASDRA